MNIGVLGGTFDPVHLGHISIAYAAYEEFGLDKVWFMPAGDPYFKDGTSVTPPSLRLEMTQIGIRRYNDIFECSDVEINDTENTYSAVTFEKLNTLMYPDDKFFFIMGFDSLNNLHKWYRPDILLKNAVLLCAARDEQLCSEDKMFEVIDRLKTDYADSDPDIRIIHTPFVDLSSTMVRKMVSEGKDVSELVGKDLAEFIAEHHLYQHKNAAEKNKTHH
ncbi:MAG: nicotinate-nucleotide adenylyltransferase [Eubacteriales bacterium]|nr:nicotinate-nucleotide adenylyltransferase [Eubacteriales bacterium]